jgi:hypothetical protein
MVMGTQTTNSSIGCTLTYSYTSSTRSRISVKYKNNFFRNIAYQWFSIKIVIQTLSNIIEFSAYYAFMHTQDL